MKFRYIGGGDSPPLKTTAFGCLFILNETTEVVDSLAIEKLSGNRCFEAVVEESAVPEVIEEESGPTITDLAQAEMPPDEPPPEPENLVPVEIKYAKKPGRPKGASTRT